MFALLCDVSTCLVETPCLPKRPKRRSGRSSRRSALLLSVLVLAFLAMLWLVGCKASSDAPTRTELFVFAASSLTEAFHELEREFEASNPDVDVKLTLAGSQVLRLQITQGAAADVFASANESHMQALVESGHVKTPSVFAHNELVVIVPATNPAGITQFSELSRAERIVIGTKNVPVGTYTRQMLERARRQLGEEFAAQVEKHVVSQESNVRLVRAKVEMAEADAAIVYRTDGVSSSKVRVVDIPEELNPRASYPIAPLTRSGHGTSGQAFVAFVLSPKGRHVLERHGFVSVDK